MPWRLELKWRAAKATLLLGVIMTVLGLLDILTM